MKRIKRTNIFKPYKLENVLDMDYSGWSGQEITDLLVAVHDNYSYFIKSKHNPELTIYYYDVLSKLVKTYGH